MGKPDRVGVMHRPAAPRRKPVAIDPDHIDIAGGVRDAFIENARALVDHREQQTFDDVLWLECMPGDAEPVGRRQNDLLYVLVRFGRARARLIEVEAPAGLLAKASKLAQLIGDRRTETLRLAHAPADVET